MFLGTMNVWPSWVQGATYSGALGGATIDQTLLNELGQGSPTGTLDPSQIEHLTPGMRKIIDKFVGYRQSLLKTYALLVSYQQVYAQRQDKGDSNAGDRVEEISNYQQFIRSTLYQMPTFGKTKEMAPGEAGGWVIAHIYNITQYTSGPYFKKAVPKIREIQSKLPIYQKEVGEEIKKVKEEGIRGPGEYKGLEYAVFLAGKDVLVGQSRALEQIRVCDMKGWGTDCAKKVGQVVQLNRISDLFNTLEEAKRYFCDRLMIYSNDKENPSPRVVPLTGGRDRQARLTYDNQYYNIQNAPNCSRR
jgi:hypothetical protein